MNRKRIPTCPICNEPTDSTDEKILPFCSRRCHQVDLSRWLGEDYSMPFEGEQLVESQYPIEEEID